MPQNPDDHRYPTPTASIFEGVEPYIPLLLAAVDAELGRESVWEEGEEATALSYVEDVRVWLQELESYMVPIGGVLPFFAGAVPTNYLLCDGSAVNKADYPALYALLQGYVGETQTTFNLPNFSDRIPIGAGQIVDVLAAAGASGHTLTTAEMPGHSHNVGTHQHLVAGHNHTIPAHDHTVPDHVHGLVAHSHNVTIPAHTHIIPGRNNSALGASGRFPVTNGTGSVNDTIDTDTGGGGTFASTNAGGGATNTNTVSPLVTSEEPSTSTGTNADALTGFGGGGGTSNEGGGQAFSILPPVLGVNYIIRAK